MTTRIAQGAILHSDSIALTGPIPPVDSVLIFSVLDPPNRNSIRGGTQIIVREAGSDFIKIDGPLNVSLPGICHGDFVYVDLEATAYMRQARREWLERSSIIRSLALDWKLNCEDAGVGFVWRSPR